MALPVRPVGDANVVVRHNEKLAPQQVFFMLRQHTFELAGFLRQAEFRQPQKDDAGVPEAFLEYKLTEIQIRHNEYSLLPSRNIQHVSIRHAVRVVPRNGRYVVTKIAKKRDKPEVGALIEQKLHSVANRTASLVHCRSGYSIRILKPQAFRRA